MGGEHKLLLLGNGGLYRGCGRMRVSVTAPEDSISPSQFAAFAARAACGVDKAAAVEEFTIAGHDATAACAGISKMVFLRMEGAAAVDPKWVQIEKTASREATCVAAILAWPAEEEI